MAIDLSEALPGALGVCMHFWKKDLAAFAPEDLVRSPGGEARSAADIAYEIIQENRASAMMLRGEDPGPYPGFPVCPPELANAESLTSAIQETVEEIVEAMGDPSREVSTPQGVRTAFDLVLFVKFHMDYHVGQINLLHTLYGDRKIHWS